MDKRQSTGALDVADRRSFVTLSLLDRSTSRMLNSDHINPF